MKKWMIFLLALVMCLSFAACGEEHEEIGSEGLVYVRNDDGTYTVSGIGTCTDSHVVIPQYHEGKRVSAIAESAFYDCQTMEEITIPETIEDIGLRIFDQCSALHTIYYNSPYSPQGAYIVDHCWQDNLFIAESNVQKMVFGGRVVPQNICRYADNITEVVFLDSVTIIDDCAFEGCSGLTSIEIPDSVIGVDNQAFRDCTGLVRVELPDDVIICDGAFSGCSSLEDVEFYASTTSFDPNVDQNALRDSDGYFLISPSRCFQISYRAFADCISLTSIEIPYGITGIGERAFEGCSGLTSVKISDTVTHIDYAAFRSCSSLASIELPDSVIAIDDAAFYDCISLRSIVIPDSVTSFGQSRFSVFEGVFTNCSSLACVTIGNGVTQISDYAFSGCINLTTIVMPDSITEISHYAFKGCSSLTGIHIPDSVTSLGNQAFSGCSSLERIEIADSITNIGKFAFWHCSSLAEIHFGGTEGQWIAIFKDYYWDANTDKYIIYCTDGEIKK